MHSITDYIDRLLQQAIESQATDIHLEASPEGMQVRLRVDGVLELRERIPKVLETNLLSKLKLLGGLVPEEKRLPQDGHFSLTIHRKVVHCRVSVIPARFGESIVLRLLEKEQPLLEAARLGISAAMQPLFEAMVAEPNGLILITGPTGAGKTTTAHAILRMLDSAQSKILTVEDPVEYELDGISQIRVQESLGLTFASALRAVLRQVPDVLLIGEIRDAETAQIAIQAALTGHKVYATLHTNSTVAAVNRLGDLGVHASYIFSALKGIIHQRLVRRLCQQCCQPIEVGYLQEVLGAEVCHGFLNTSDEGGLSLSKLKVFQPQGCSLCKFKGFIGRCGAFEMLLVTPELKTVCFDPHNRDEAFVWKAVKIWNKGRHLREDVLDKLIQGVTSIEEGLLQVVL